MKIGSQIGINRVGDLAITEERLVYPFTGMLDGAYYSAGVRTSNSVVAVPTHYQRVYVWRRDTTFVGRGTGVNNPLDQGVNLYIRAYYPRDRGFWWVAVINH